MSEAIFPLLGTTIVMFLVLPACALLVKGGLVLAERAASFDVHGNLTGRYLLLTGSSVLPLAWLLSAGLHQAESGKSALSCLLDHGASESCLEPGYFALALGIAIVVSSLRHLPRSTLQARTLDHRHEGHRRIQRLIHEAPGLGKLQHRILVSDDPSFALGTTGFLRPQVIVGASFAHLLSDEMLKSALAHELAHVRELDPLRYWLLQFAVVINPLGGLLLGRHAARWREEREVQCDREAVIHGAAPLSLANAIVHAARPYRQVAAALGAQNTSCLKIRVERLLAFAERSPTPCGAHAPSTFWFALLLLLTALILPHKTTTLPLDALHTGAEQALTYLVR